jgi:hypothetical protein
MEITLSAASIITAAGVVTALGVLGGLFAKAIHFSDRVAKLERSQRADQKELELICYGLEACLDGLEQLGANHKVSEAKGKLSSHLNAAAHEEAAET